MHVPIYIAGSEDETSAELKWILPELVLTKAAGFCTLAIGCIVAAEEMKNVGLVQLRSLVCLPLFVDQ